MHQGQQMLHPWTLLAGASFSVFVSQIWTRHWARLITILPEHAGVSQQSILNIVDINVNIDYNNSTVHAVQ